MLAALEATLPATSQPRAADSHGGVKTERPLLKNPPVLSKGGLVTGPVQHKPRESHGSFASACRTGPDICLLLAWFPCWGSEIFA